MLAGKNNGTERPSTFDKAQHTPSEDFRGLGQGGSHGAAFL